jgi:FkbM family methyltransferase
MVFGASNHWNEVQNMNLVKHQTSEMELFVRSEAVRSDIGTCAEVQDRDIYRVKQLAAGGFKPRVIVDIGGHIGSFTTLAAKYWPEARIFVFEPQPANFEVLAANLPANSTAIRSAVLGYAGYSGRVIEKSHDDEPKWRAEGRCLSFRQVLEIVGGQIDFLKIDCEQSEINIFREMLELGVIGDIEVIHGEWHLPLARELVKTLLPLTHSLEIVEGHDRWDMFWARRKPVQKQRVLCYTVAVGEESWRHAEWMVRGLRQFGEFEGDVCVFADRSGKIEGANVIEVAPSMLSVAIPKLYKSIIGAKMNTANYDRVMFMDSDISIVNPIEPLLRLPVTCVSVEHFLASDPGSDWFGLPGDKWRVGDAAFNSGTIIADASEWNSLCATWLQKLRDVAAWRNNTGVDQPALNHLIKSGEIVAQPIPREWIYFFTDESLSFSRQTIGIHHKHTNKTPWMRLVHEMRQTYGNIPRRLG